MRVALYILLGIAVFCAPLYPQAQQAVGNRWLERLDSLDAEYVRAGTRRAALQARAGVIASEVEMLKSSLAGEYSRLDDYRLQAVLRRSQEVADSLDSVNAGLAALERERERLASRASRWFASRLDSLSRALGETSPESERTWLLERIGLLHEQRSALASRELPEVVAPAGGSEGRESPGLDGLAELARVEPGDTPEQVREKADFLADVAGRWERALESLEDNIHRLDEEAGMRRRLGEFAQEISLFDGAGPSSRAGGTDKRSESDEPPRRGDFALNQSMESVAKTDGPKEALDIELHSLETGAWLLNNLENLTSTDIELALEALRAKRDSLRARLDTLELLENSLRERTGVLEP